MRFAHGLSRGLLMGVLTAAVGLLARRGPATAAGRAAARRAVTTAAAVRKDMPLEVSVIGTVEAFSTVAVRAQITGELTVGQLPAG